MFTRTFGYNRCLSKVPYCGSGRRAQARWHARSVLCSTLSFKLPITKAAVDCTTELLSMFSTKAACEDGPVVFETVNANRLDLMGCCLCAHDLISRRRGLDGHRVCLRNMAFHQYDFKVPALRKLTSILGVVSLTTPCTQTNSCPRLDTEAAKHLLLAVEVAPSHLHPLPPPS
jgi:hypothetical protein